MYIVVVEYIDNEVWWGDWPVRFDTLEDCRKYIKNKKEKIPEGYEYSIYDCRLVE